MKEKLIDILYDFWKDTDDDKEQLLQEITNNINDGKDGIEVLLDWCRCDYDAVKEQYMKLHNLNEDEMQQVMEKNYGSYEFMYDEIPYIEELDKPWNICNWYLDYTQNNKMTEKDLLELIERGGI